MGFCIHGNDQYDVFLSYAHVDDSHHIHWICDFEKYLRDQLITELELTGEVRREDASLLKVCRDETGFPQGGELKVTIREKVRQSQYLIIFLGRGYLNSEWCLAELDMFRENAGKGTIEGVLRRAYLIILDREVVDRLRENNEPKQLPPERLRLWTNLRDVTQRAIRKEDFLLSDDRLMPVFRTEERPHWDFHSKCTPLVKELACKLIKIRGKSRSDSASPLGECTAIGTVPGRLEAARDDLMKALSTEMFRIEESDLRQPSVQIRKRLKDAKLLIQPFDHFEPLCERGDPPGGHLALQQKLFEECHSRDPAGSRASILWWEPQSAPASGAKLPHDYDKVFIASLPYEQIRRCSAQELATEFREKKPSLTAQVWVEWEESQKQRIKRAKELVREVFYAHCEKRKDQHLGSNVKLEFADADWATLQRGLEVKPDGVVIVYNNNKDFRAFWQQKEAIADLEEIYLKTMFPGIFYMESGRLHLEGFSVVHFAVHNNDLKYDDEELREFASNLFDTLCRKYARQTRPAPDV